MFYIEHLPSRSAFGMRLSSSKHSIVVFKNKEHAIHVANTLSTNLYSSETKSKSLMLPSNNTIHPSIKIHEKPFPLIMSNLMLYNLAMQLVVDIMDDEENEAMTFESRILEGSFNLNNYIQALENMYDNS
jgi:hypothetical protein